MHHDDITRYRLELDVLERDGALSNRRAIDLLRSEFALALNASYLMGLSAGDIEVGFISRSHSAGGRRALRRSCSSSSSVPRR